MGKEGRINWAPLAAAVATIAGGDSRLNRFPVVWVIKEDLRIQTEQRDKTEQVSENFGRSYRERERDRDIDRDVCPPPLISSSGKKNGSSR